MLLFLVACDRTSIGVSPVDTAGRETAADTATKDSADTDTSGSDSGGSADSVDSGGETGEDTDTVPVEVPPPCTVYADPVPMGIVEDEELDEISGVAASTRNPGVLWVLEDHSGPAAFSAMDVTGASLGTLELDAAENDDWEAIALAPCDAGTCLWAADLGDNLLEREEVGLYRVEEPEVPEGGLDLSLPATYFPIAWPEGPRNVEAFTLTPDGRPVFLTKEFDGRTEVWIVDALDEEAAATPRFIASLTTRPEDAEFAGVVTSADLWPDGTRLLVRAYDRAWEYDLGEAGVEGIATAPVLDIPFSIVDHVESIAYDTVSLGFWQIPEAVNAPIAFTPCAG